MLRRHPYSGRPGTQEETRELVISDLPYLVSYRVKEPDAVEIFHVWHGAQDWQ